MMNELQPSYCVQTELAMVDGLVVRDSKAVIPEA